MILVIEGKKRRVVDNETNSVIALTAFKLAELFREVQKKELDKGKPFRDKVNRAT